MRKFIICFSAFLISVLSLLVISCSEDENEKDRFNIKYNKKPKYTKNPFQINKLHEIETLTDKYSISQIFDITADEKNNLYILSQYDNEGTINKFSGKGEHIKIFGARGHAPGELMVPRVFTYHNGKLHIFENYQGFKILSSDGEYVDNPRYIIYNLDKIKMINNDYLIMKGSIGKNGESSKRKYELFCLSNDLKNRRNLLTYEQYFKDAPMFTPHNIFEVDKKNCFYFPEYYDIYSLIKYNSEGNIIHTIQREYNRQLYTDETYDILDKRWGKRNINMPKYPPVIRKVLIDDRNNVWVVSGEWGVDSRKTGITAEVDIYNEDGEWLYNFKTDKISSLSFIKNNRLYSLPELYKPEDAIRISVYEFKYDK